MDILKLFLELCVFLSIPAILDDQRMDPKVSFISLKWRLTELLQKLLLAETDSVNTQMLLGRSSMHF